MTVANTYDPSSLTVTKTVTGTAPAGTEFTVDVDCSNNTFDQTLTFDADGDADPAGSNVISGIPNTTTCSGHRAGDGGASSTTYAPDGGTPADPPTVTITSGTPSTVAVTNIYDPSSLAVTKTVTGTAPPGRTFTVDVDCSDNTFDTTLTFDATGTLTGGTSPITGIPNTTTCSVTESGTGGASSTTYAPTAARRRIRPRSRSPRVRRPRWRSPTSTTRAR